LVGSWPLLANIRPGSKYLPRRKALAYFLLGKEKSFITLTPAGSLGKEVD